MTDCDSTEHPNLPRPFHAIERIEVCELFGRYTYSIAAADRPNDQRPLLLLYGDNGCGKTTILKLVYHLLAAAPKHGHRGFATGIPFRSFVVTLTGDTVVAATRAGLDLVGDYLLSVKDSSGTAEWLVLADRDAARVADKSGRAEVLAKLESLGLALFFLGDDRILRSSTFETSEKPDETDDVLRSQLLHEWARRKSRAPSQDPSSREIALKQSIERVEKWLSGARFSAFDKGEADTHAAYRAVVQQILRFSAGEPEMQRMPPPNELASRLAEVRDRTKDFELAGLTPPPEYDDLIGMLQDAPQTSNALLVRVVEPYIAGLKAKLDAQQPTLDLLQSFQSTVNGFLSQKRVFLHAKFGMLVLVPRKAEDELGVIEPDRLSSGEKQLLLLLCNAFAARNTASVFIIDEPELSLNVKWQRQLIAALLGLTKGTNGQFVVASHSTELYAQHLPAVRRLDPSRASDTVYAP